MNFKLFRISFRLIMGLKTKCRVIELPLEVGIWWVFRERWKCHSMKEFNRNNNKRISKETKNIKAERLGITRRQNLSNSPKKVIIIKNLKVKHRVLLIHK